jgi:hypothetical protein
MQRFGKWIFFMSVEGDNYSVGSLKKELTSITDAVILNRKLTRNVFENVSETRPT